MKKKIKEKTRDEFGNKLPRGVYYTPPRWDSQIVVKNIIHTTSHTSEEDALNGAVALKRKYYPKEKLEQFEFLNALDMELPPLTYVYRSRNTVMLSVKVPGIRKSFSSKFLGVADLKVKIPLLEQRRIDFCNDNNIDLSALDDAVTPSSNNVIYIKGYYTVGKLFGDRPQRVETLEAAMAVLNGLHREIQILPGGCCAKPRSTRKDRDLPVGIFSNLFKSKLADGTQVVYNVIQTAISWKGKVVFSTMRNWGINRTKQEAVDSIIEARQKFLDANPKYLTRREGINSYNLLRT